MCIRIIERYAVCRCVYHSHGVDPCPAWGKAGHQVREKEVLVGYTCSRHHASSLESLPENTQLRNIRRPYSPVTTERIPQKTGNALSHVEDEHVRESLPNVVQPAQVVTQETASTDDATVPSHPIEPQSASPPTPHRQHFHSLRPCHLLLLLGTLTIMGSLTAALWRAARFDDLSGGFTLAQYILGVGVFVTGSMTAIHSKTCTCWQRWGVPPEAIAGVGDGDRP